MLRNSKGMTLLEIMIVLAILGGLIGILGTQVQKQFAKAKVKQAKIEMSEIAKNLDLFYTDCGFYPSSEAGLEALVDGANSGCENWGPEAYLRKLPRDPWGSPYIYELNGSSYILISLGDDKVEGGKDYGKDLSSEDLN